MNLDDLQQRVGAWHRRHFPICDSTRIVLKTVEECGELAKARERRLSWHLPGVATGAELDAIGDILVCLAALCAREGYNLTEIAEDTMRQIESRDHRRVTGGMMFAAEEVS